MIFDDIIGPNENRFVNINHLPNVSSKVHNSEAPNFKRYVVRDLNKVRNNISAIHNFHA